MSLWDALSGRNYALNKYVVPEVSRILDVADSFQPRSVERHLFNGLGEACAVLLCAWWDTEDVPSEEGPLAFRNDLKRSVRNLNRTTARRLIKYLAAHFFLGLYTANDGQLPPRWNLAFGDLERTFITELGFSPSEIEDYNSLKERRGADSSAYYVGLYRIICQRCFGFDCQSLTTALGFARLLQLGSEVFTQQVKRFRRLP